MQDAYTASIATHQGLSNADPLAECREFALACLPMAVSQSLSDALAELSRRAGSLGGAPEAIEQTLLALRNRHGDVMAGFHERLAGNSSGYAVFERMVGAKDVPTVIQPGLMLEDEHYDFTAPDTIAAAIATACNIELYGLNKRFEFLLGSRLHRELSFGPRPIGRALMDALKDAGMPLQIRQQLLPCLIEYLPGNVRGVYQALNQALIVRGVLPQMRAGAVDKGAASAMASACWDWIVRRTESSGTVKPDAMRRPLIRRLDVAEQNALLHDAGLDIEGLLAGGANLAREIESALSDSLGAAEKVLLNWLAILFDGVFTRSDLGEDYREVLSRLQWPLLKAALREQERLTDDVSHPAQRLFGAWVAAVDERGATEDDGLALLEQMRSVLASLCEADKPTDFALAWDRWCAFRSGKPAIPFDVDKYAHIAEPVRLAISERRIPAALEAFLLGYRLSVLAGIGARYGEGGVQWQEAVAAMDMLLTTLEPANWRRNRAGILDILPGMLERLRKSMEAADMAPAVRDEFLADLVKYHAAFMKATQAKAARPK